MAQNDLEKQRYSEQVERSLTRAGIGKLYHKKKLADFGVAGKAILDAQNDVNEFRAYVRSGKGYTLRSKQEATAYEFCMVMAKSFHLMQFKTRVLTLPSIVDFIKNGYDPEIDSRFEAIDTVECLVIPRFFETMDAMPLSRAEFYRLEEFFVSRMEECCSVSVQYSGDLGKCQWWSRYFIDRLRMTNREILV